MSEDLKPCPFCGAAFKMSQEPPDNGSVAGMFYLFHEYGPLGSAARKCPIGIRRHFASAEDAVAAWNTRACDSGGLPEGHDAVERHDAEQARAAPEEGHRPNPVSDTARDALTKAARAMFDEAQTMCDEEMSDGFIRRFWNEVTDEEREGFTRLARAALTTLKTYEQGFRGIDPTSASHAAVLADLARRIDDE